MKKTLVIALLVILVFSAAFADEESPATFEFAARYYPSSMNISGFDNETMNYFWLEGNIFFGKESDWKGTLEWMSAHTSGFTCKSRGICSELKNNQFIARIGYDFWGDLYTTLSYKSFKIDVTPEFFIPAYSRSYGGFGIGLEKDFDLAEDWNATANLHYYPSLSGDDGAPYSAFEYDLGVKYHWESFVDLSAGYRGESWSGDNFSRAGGSTITVSGPYVGISKRF